MELVSSNYSHYIVLLFVLKLKNPVKCESAAESEQNCTSFGLITGCCQLLASVERLCEPANLVRVFMKV
jgi:hypothetical protein